MQEKVHYAQGEGTSCTSGRYITYKWKCCTSCRSKRESPVSRGLYRAQKLSQKGRRGRPADAGGHEDAKEEETGAEMEDRGATSRIPKFLGHNCVLYNRARQKMVPMGPAEGGGGGKGAKRRFYELWGIRYGFKYKNTCSCTRSLVEEYHVKTLSSVMLVFVQQDRLDKAE